MERKMKLRNVGGFFCATLSGIALATSCHSAAGSQEEAGQASPGRHSSIMASRPAAVPSPPACVYKTKKDYSHNVPVTMDASRTQIVSYPDPKDMYLNGKLALPTPLDDGFLLDNRGINEHVAFLSYTYEEYSQLKEAPGRAQLMEKIIDKDPLTEIHFCGLRSDYKDIVKELNELIGKGF